MLAASLDGFLLFWQPANELTLILFFLFDILIVRGK